MRLLRLINQIDWTAITGNQFITVTYPDAIDHRDYEGRSVDRFKLLRYIEKFQGHNTPTLWRCEWKQRQSGRNVGLLFPHFHYAVMKASPIPEGDLRSMWQRTIGYRHSNLQVNSQEIYGVEGAVRYLAKYISKSGPLDISAYHNNHVKFGRHWGITRKALIPMCPVTVFRELTAEESATMRKVGAERLQHYHEEQGRSFTLLSEDSATYWAAHMNASGQPSQGNLY